jgi:hypothetical protein
MLPTRLDRRLSWPGLREKRGERATVFNADRMSNREVVQLAIRMPKPQYEPRRAAITGDANNSAVDGPVALHLDPITRAACHVWPIDTLGDHPFETGDPKPGLCHLDVGSVRHELEARMTRRKQLLEEESPLLALIPPLLLGTSRVQRVSLVAYALMIVGFIAFESLGSGHSRGYSPTGALISRAVFEDRYTQVELARYFRVQLPPSARNVHSFGTVWDGQIYVRFDLEAVDLPSIMEHFGPGLPKHSWEVDAIGPPVDWWNVDDLQFEQSSTNVLSRFALRRGDGQATVYFVFLQT